MNEAIRFPEIRLIDERGEMVGAMPTSRALDLARERGLDLVEVNPVAQPPICKLLNWGAYQYQQEKLERKSRLRQHKIEIKGIRLSLKIGKHDLELRRNQARRFFIRGDKVKVELILRGRERQHESRARQLVTEFITSLGDGAYLEQPLSKQGGRMSLVVGWRGNTASLKQALETEGVPEEEAPKETEADQPEAATEESEAPDKSPEASKEQTHEA